MSSSVANVSCSAWNSNNYKMAENQCLDFQMWKSINQRYLNKNISKVSLVNLFDKTCIGMRQTNYKINEKTHLNCDKVQLYFAPYLYKKLKFTLMNNDEYFSIANPKYYSLDKDVTDYTLDVCFICIAFKYKSLDDIHNYQLWQNLSLVHSMRRQDAFESLQDRMGSIAADLLNHGSFDSN